MDMAAQLTTNLNTEVLKEPRGFIKFIQVVMAIFAFATTCGHSSKATFVITCPGTTPVDHYKEMSWGYPPVLSADRNGVRVPVCNSTMPQRLLLPYGDFSAPSQFYVFIGVMAFLYSLAALVLYVKFDDLYRKNDKVAIADFLITIGLAVFFLISSAAWAQGLTDLKYYSDPAEFYSNNIPDCQVKDACRTSQSGNYAGLNVSIIFGFANMALWAGNLWFLYKETPWFKAKVPEGQDQPAPTMQTPETPGMSPGGMGPGMTPGMGQV